MMREWFCSCWSLQVLALARRATLYCGHAQIDRLDFEAALSLLEAAAINSQLRHSRLYDFVLNDKECRPAARLLGVTSDFRRTENGHIWGRYLSLEDLVCKVSHFRTTKPHDVIYSVLALSNNIIPMPVELDKPRIERSVPTEMQKELFLVDYEKPFIDVCKEFLTHAIKAKQSLDIICRPWVPVTSIEDQGKPSWLLTTEQASYRLWPDGKFAGAHADPLVGPAGLGKRNYSASGQSKVVPAWPLFGTGAKERFMYVEGFVIDTVGVKMPYTPDDIIPQEWLKAGDWSDESALPPPQFWRTLCADRGPNGSNPPTFYPRACKAALNHSEYGDIATEIIIRTGKSTLVAGFLKRVQEVIWRRRLIKTKGGTGENDLPRLGLAPQLTKKRDLICILYGCSVPVVLRKKHAGKPDEHYEFIGECYVHGIMEGEAFDLIRRRNGSETIPKQVFELR